MAVDAVLRVVAPLRQPVAAVAQAAAVVVRLQPQRRARLRQQQLRFLLSRALMALHRQRVAAAVGVVVAAQLVVADVAPAVRLRLRQARPSS